MEVKGEERNEVPHPPIFSRRSPKKQPRIWKSLQLVPPLAKKKTAKKTDVKEGFRFFQIHHFRTAKLREMRGKKIERKSSSC